MHQSSRATHLCSPLTALSAACLLMGAVQAGETAPSAKEPAAPPVIDTAPAKDWWFSATLYGWLTDTTGDIGVRGFTAPVNIGMDDVLDDLDFAYMSYFEIGRGKWSLGVDGVYAKLSDDQTFAVGPVSGTASLEQEEAFITTRLQYRVVDTSRATIDGFTGFRWNYFSVDLDIDPNIGGRTFEVGRSEDWFDVIVGARAIIPMGDRWYFQAAGDIGGFGGAESQLTWQALAGFGYRFNNSVSAVCGYRALGVDYEGGDFMLDVVSHGPAIGLNFTF